MSEYVPRITHIQYDGTNSSDIVDFANAIYQESGESFIWQIDSESGGVLVLGAYDGATLSHQATLNTDDRLLRRRMSSSTVFIQGPFTPAEFEDAFAMVPSCGCQ